MVKNESLFSFGKINKYFIIPFLCPIFCFLLNHFFKLYFISINIEENINFYISIKRYLYKNYKLERKYI